MHVQVLQIVIVIQCQVFFLASHLLLSTILLIIIFSFQNRLHHVLTPNNHKNRSTTAAGVSFLPLRRTKQASRSHAQQPIAFQDLQ